MEGCSPCAYSSSFCTPQACIIFWKNFPFYAKWRGPFRFQSTAIFGTRSDPPFTGRTGWTKMCSSILKIRLIPLLLITRFHICRKLGTGLKKGDSHCSCLAKFDRKMSFHLLRLVPLVSDRSLWHNDTIFSFGKYNSYYKTIRVS